MIDEELIELIELGCDEEEPDECMELVSAAEEDRIQEENEQQKCGILSEIVPEEEVSGETGGEEYTSFPPSGKELLDRFRKKKKEKRKKRSGIQVFGNFMYVMSVVSLLFALLTRIFF